MVARPWSSSPLSCGGRLLLTCDGNGEIPSKRIRERIPHLQLKGGNGAPRDVGRTPCFFSSGDGYVGERGPPGEITWAPRGNHVGPPGQSRGNLGSITWAPRGNHVGPRGNHVGPQGQSRGPPGTVQGKAHT